jgi:hypothetical protein
MLMPRAPLAAVTLPVALRPAAPRPMVPWRAVPRPMAPELAWAAPMSGGGGRAPRAGQGYIYSELEFSTCSKQFFNVVTTYLHFSPNSCIMLDIVNYVPRCWANHCLKSTVVTNVRLFCEYKSIGFFYYFVVITYCFVHRHNI